MVLAGSVHPGNGHAGGAARPLGMPRRLLPRQARRCRRVGRVPGTPEPSTFHDRA